jgi:hypothetical protein
MGKMEKKESFLNLMQEQKQICEKCYLWDNDGCYCASDGRNTKVCEFFNHIDALYSDLPLKWYALIAKVQGNSTLMAKSIMLMNTFPRLYALIATALAKSPRLNLQKR